MLTATFENRLPDAKSAKHRGYKFARPEAVCGGTLTYQAKGEVSRYWMEEVPSDLAGRGFRFVKVIRPGTKDEGGCHDVFVGEGNQPDDCDCLGFASAGHCKHLDTVKDLLANGQLPALTATDADALCDPDADCGPTEPDAGLDEWCDRTETANEHIARVRRRWAEMGLETARA